MLYLLAWYFTTGWTYDQSMRPNFKALSGYLETMLNNPTKFIHTSVEDTLCILYMYMYCTSISIQ